MPGRQFIRTKHRSQHHRNRAVAVHGCSKRCPLRTTAISKRVITHVNIAVHDTPLRVEAGGRADPCPTCGRATETVTEENYFFTSCPDSSKAGLISTAHNPYFISRRAADNEVLTS